ncbi:Nucleic acid dioxygenase ALKBH1 [Blattella germanica]|nr:Nucleic acid dioxygenase ALKBH1 [Blattella germanica]
MYDCTLQVYSEDMHAPFPEDLAKLCGFVARVLGFGDFSAEAAIVNFYHMDSTLSGHTDHSEVDKEAPLFSFRLVPITSLTYLNSYSILIIMKKIFAFSVLIDCTGHHEDATHIVTVVLLSFGQSAIFLLGGESLEEKPTAMLIRSGDIMVMSGESRLCYHGVPRIIQADEFPWSECNDKTWEPFESYLSSSRINMNVRQVLNPGSKGL